MKIFTRRILPCTAHFAVRVRRKVPILFTFILLLTGFMPAFSQTKTAVTGVVKTADGEPMPGVTVLEKGTRNATNTDVNGAFKLNVAGTGAVLVFTSIGSATQEVAVGQQLTFDVKMQSQGKDINEVVVVGYGQTKRAGITGSVAAVTAEDIGRVHGNATVSSTLAGKLPGVSFRMPDGRPGASANIQIRNLGNPLYVIDGIQQDAGQFNNIAPNDIETITVLKDASAAIYGVRAANGVVVVTTKRGKVGSRNTVNVDAYYGIQNWTNFVDVLTNSYDYMRLRAEAEMNDVNPTTNITPAELEKYKQGTEPGYQSFNWKDYIIQGDAPISSYNINATGGSDRVNYYVSYTKIYQNSVLGREFKFNRNNLQSNVTARIADGLKVGVNVNGRIEIRQNPGVPQVDDYWLARFAILRNTPLERPYANDNPNYLNDIKHNETNWAYLNYKNSGKYKNEWRVLQTDFNAEYEVPWVKGLTLKGVYSYYIADNILNNHEYTYETYTYNPTDDTYKATGGSINPWREREQQKVYNVTIQGQASYANSFGKNNISAVFVAERFKRQNLFNRVHSVPTTNTLPLIYFSTMDEYVDRDDRQARIGYIARISYNYDEKYYIELSGRRDASYLFAPDKRVGYFPGGSAGWRISKEPFFKGWVGNFPISELKIRGSLGQMGDDGDALGLGAYSYIQGYNYNSGVGIFDGKVVIGSQDRGVPITNISWLKSTISNIGVDYGFFNNALTGSTEYYYRKRTGLRGRKSNVLVPSEIGYNLPDENINSDAQYGIETALSYSGKVKQVNFSVGGNFSYSRSKFLSSYNPVFFNSWDKYRSSREDRFTKTNWGYHVLGQFQSQEEINNYPVNIDGQGNRTLLPGDLIYEDKNGDGKINGLDERPIGYGVGTQPNINFGFNLMVAYKGIDFRADFSGAAGYTWYQNYETKWAFQNDGNLNTIFLDRWHREDPYDVNSKWIPGKYPALRFNKGGHSNYNNSNDFWAHNARYVRARTIELGYTFPAAWLAKVKIYKCRIYANGYNLFTFSNLNAYKIDPEVNDENGLQFPQNKVMNVGINLSL